MSRFALLVTAFVVALTTLVAPSSARALTATFEDCDSCFGNDVKVEIIEVADSQYKVIYTIDTTDFARDLGAKTGHTNFLAVAVKAFKPGDDFAVQLTSDPNGSFGSAVLGGLSNNLCGNQGKSGWFCVEGNLPIPAPGGDQIHVWEFDVEDGELQETVSAKFNIGPSNGWLMSEERTLIPEPTSALLFVVGLWVTGRALSHARRR